ncbi:metal dependent phosphohydrolase [Paraglaciecola mesophila KMM 241]|uniref:Metal dependent phosphohydrolase n=1 Tax=Paraglaciecola mesophila KMM 241 TaxID=1128912 RepID=K6YK69_9ALTE|nr:HDOD domain-containing protein [Paraglaciecola mesophila]GAC24376.1 metal dependent phosphohydrolase [Paraglaciecola mesophila KMM 241]|tara:strand:- start:2351 stop:3493 length:1143 start_codon:yes stop_codon:yes gene_type:complete
MFEKLISRLFKRSRPSSAANNEKGALSNSGSAVASVNRQQNNKLKPENSTEQTSDDAETYEIPIPTRTVNISVASLNRLDFLFYDYLLGPSQTSTTLNPIEQYILTRVNHALKSPDSVLTHFPVLPQSVISLTNLLNNPDFNLQSFIKVVEQEPSIATELMKKANSPAYKRGDKDITNLQQAFMFMGANDIKEFVLNRFIKNLCQQKPIYFKTFGEKIWLHSQDVAIVTKTLAARRKQNADAAYTIGLMHDLGKVVIFQFMVEAFKMIDPDFKQDSLVFKKFLSEKSMLLSVELMKIWNMPSVIIDVVQGQVEDFTNVNDLDPMTAILFEANLISEVSLSYQDGHIQPAEFELLVSSTKLRDDAKLLLREILNIYSDEAS